MKRPAALLCALIVFAPSAYAETFGLKFSKCVVQEEKKPGYDKERAWALCEKKAQAERDSELSPGPNMRLLKPAVAVHFCVEKQARDAIESANRARFKGPSEAEAYIWKSVMERCFKVVVADENQGMIYQNYSGDSSQILAFNDGVIYAARAYVFTVVDDWYGIRR